MHVVVAAGARDGDGTGPAIGSRLRGLFHHTDLAIAADAGADLLLAGGRTPDILVGDLDSITQSARAACAAAGVELHELPAAKDESDTEYALRLAVERGAARITLVGALGGPRLDHLLANVFLLTAPWLVHRDVRLVDERHEVFLARGDTRVCGRTGDLVSLLPLTAEVADVLTDGLAYPLRGEPLLMGASRGVSNVLVAEEARVRHGEGVLLVVHEDGGPGAEKIILQEKKK